MAHSLIPISILLCFFIVIAHTAPPNPPTRENPPSRFRVISDTFHQDPNLEYSFDQQFENGEQFSQDGKLKTVKGMEVIVNKGSYTIKNADGSETIVNYTADEDGFHAEVITPASPVSHY